MALGFDLPCEKLETYQGTNPRPDDFDAYWETALAEMNTVDPQIEITPVGFQHPMQPAPISGSQVLVGHAFIQNYYSRKMPHSPVRRF